MTNCPLTALVLGFEVFYFCNPGGFLVAVAASFLVSGYSGLYAKQKFAFSKTGQPRGPAPWRTAKTTPPSGKGAAVWRPYARALPLRNWLLVIQ